MCSDESDTVEEVQTEPSRAVRILRTVSPVMLVAGLALLIFFFGERDNPCVRIGEITPGMNHATVRILGEVVRNPSFPESGGFVFPVQDGSGEIAVRGGRAQAEALSAAGRIPRRGDWVDVTGSLGTDADRKPALCVLSSRQFSLQRARAELPPAETPCTPPSEVTADRRGEILRVCGTLKTVEIPGPGAKTPCRLTLEEGGAELEVILWDDVFRDLEGRFPVPGKKICADGQVTVFRNRVQLKMMDANGLRTVTAEKAAR